MPRVGKHISRETESQLHSYARVVSMRSHLPKCWRDDVQDMADEAYDKPLPASLTLARASTGSVLGRVDGPVVVRRWPWVKQIYRGPARRLVQSAAGEPVFPAADPRYGVVLNVQRGCSQYILPHVDSNPWTGLLFLTSHRLAEGGALIMGLDPEAMGVEHVDGHFVPLVPLAGDFAIFSATDKPHYTRRLVDETALRVVAVMNFYTKYSPEAARPRALNIEHFGEP